MVNYRTVLKGGYDWHNSKFWSFDKFSRELSWWEPSLKESGVIEVPKIFWLIHG